MTDMVRPSDISLAEIALNNLKLQWEQEGKPIDARELRFMLQDIANHVEHLRGLIVNLSNAVFAIDAKKAEEFGVVAEIPF